MKFGINTSHMFGGFTDNIVNQAVIDKINLLKPSVLRFPGGSIANKYHFDQTGYAGEKSADKNHVEHFADMVSKLNYKPGVLFVLNMYEHFTGTGSGTELFEENMRAYKRLRQIAPIYGVELGNEFYLYSEITNTILFLNTFYVNRINKANIELYDYWSKRYIAAIRKIDPTMEFAVPLGNIKNKKHIPWNDAVLELNLTKNYVSHFYGLINEGEKTLKWHQGVIKETLEWYKKRNLKCWVTEYNAINHSFDGTEGVEYHDSFLQMKYTEENFKLFTEYNYLVDNVIYHRLITEETVNPVYSLLFVTKDQSIKTTKMFSSLLTQRNKFE